MGIRLLSLEEYLRLGLKPSTVFGSEGFVRLNAAKVDRIVGVSDGRVGVVFGERHDRLCAPWSAPYFSLDKIDESVTRSEVEAFGREVRKTLANKSLRLITPPESYDSLEGAFVSGMERDGDKVIRDTSFHIPLAEFSLTDWHENPRRNLKKATKAGLRLESGTNLANAYRFIAEHHRQLGYEMAMTEKDVVETARVIPIDVHQVLKGDEVVAATYCYRVRPDVVQLINCGDTPEGRVVGAMSFLLYSIFEVYKHELVDKKGFANAIFDYGPTSTDGVQNEGLARYKASVGCRLTYKTTLAAD